MENFMKSPKISVIIPAYNVEAYLEQCLNSIIAQTLDDIEVICIDDGSEDSSLRILKEYAAAHPRIKVIASSHIGTGNCRNLALQQAHGEYIGFVDPDDYIEPTYFEKLYNAAAKSANFPDIVFQTSRIEFDNNTGKKQTIYTTQDPNSDKQRFYIIQESAHLWSKIFKHSFIKKYNLQNASTRRSQDLMFSIPAILLAKEICCINNAQYFYRKGHKSACQAPYTQKDIDEQIVLYKEIENKVLHYIPNAATWVNLKKNIMFNFINRQLDKNLQTYFAAKIKDDFFIDFKLNLPDCTKITLKNPSPNNIDKFWWGDYWLGLDLAAGLKNLGYNVKTDYCENFDKKSDSKINIAICGLTHQKKIEHNKINILYIISNPDKIKFSQLFQYDIIIVGSIKFCNTLKRKNLNAFYLPQFTNSARFFPEKDEAFHHQLLFVGNAYKGIRPAVKYAVKNNLPISVYGKFWENFIHPKHIKDTYLDNNQLHKYYSNADIVLADTNENMKNLGFIPNRIYDVTACKGFIISDYMPEIEEIYGDAVPMYKNEQEFIQLVTYYLAHPQERKAKAEKAYKITVENYTNKNFVSSLDTIIKSYRRSLLKKILLLLKRGLYHLYHTDQTKKRKVIYIMGLKISYRNRKNK